MKEQSSRQRGEWDHKNAKRLVPQNPNTPLKGRLTSAQRWDPHQRNSKTHDTPKIRSPIPVLEPPGFNMLQNDIYMYLVNQCSL